MEIKVTDIELNEIIYEGDADEFLFINENDESLEELLTELDTMPMGTKKSYYGNFCSEYIFEKTENYI